MASISINPFGGSGKHHTAEPKPHAAPPHNTITKTDLPPGSNDIAQSYLDGNRGTNSATTSGNSISNAPGSTTDVNLRGKELDTTLGALRNEFKKTAEAEHAGNVEKLSAKERSDAIEKTFFEYARLSKAPLTSDLTAKIKAETALAGVDNFSGIGVTKRTVHDNEIALQTYATAQKHPDWNLTQVKDFMQDAIKLRAAGYGTIKLSFNGASSGDLPPLLKEYNNEVAPEHSMTKEFTELLAACRAIHEEPKFLPPHREVKSGHVIGLPGIGFK